MNQPRYFYLGGADGKEEYGPYTSKDLIALAGNGTLKPTSLVRREDSDTPSAAREWPALAKVFAGAKPATGLMDRATAAYAAMQVDRLDAKPKTERELLESIAGIITFWHVVLLVHLVVGWLAAIVLFVASASK